MRRVFDSLIFIGKFIAPQPERAVKFKWHGRLARVFQIKITGGPPVPPHAIIATHVSALRPPSSPVVTINSPLIKPPTGARRGAGMESNVDQVLVAGSKSTTLDRAAPPVVSPPISTILPSATVVTACDLACGRLATGV